MKVMDMKSLLLSLLILLPIVILFIGHIIIYNRKIFERFRIFNGIIKFLENINKINFLQVQFFAFPIIINNAMFKIRKELSKEEFINLYKKLDDEFKFTYVDESEMRSEDFTFYSDGNIILAFFSQVHRKLSNCLGRVWFWIPAPVWIIFNFIFIKEFCSDQLSNIYIRIIFIYFLIFSFYFLWSIFYDISLIKQYNFGFEIISRWLFVLFPIIIIFYKSMLIFYPNEFINLFFNPDGILVLYIFSIICYFVYESKYTMSEYLEILPQAINLYHNKYKKKFQGTDNPVCWLITNISLENMLDLHQDILNFYFYPFFNDVIIRKSGFKESIKYFFKKLKSFYKVEGKIFDQRKNELINLFRMSIDKKKGNLFVPYVVYPALESQKSSDYCIINFLEDRILCIRILCINLIKDVINAMVENNNLFNAKNISNIKTSYLKYHKTLIIKMKKDILNPIHPIIDPSKLENKMKEIKYYISSLIRINGLIYILKETFQNSDNDKNKDETDDNELLSEMKKGIVNLRDIFDEFLEKSSIILDAENTIKIRKLNKCVIFLTFIVVITGIIKINFFEINLLTINNINLIISDNLKKYSSQIIYLIEFFISKLGFTILIMNVLIMFFLKNKNKFVYVSTIILGVAILIFLLLKEPKISNSDANLICLILFNHFG